MPQNKDVCKNNFPEKKSQIQKCTKYTLLKFNNLKSPPAVSGKQSMSQLGFFSAGRR
jgi:hypothetical protein